MAERNDAARTSCRALGARLTVLVDAMDDRVGHAYSGMPDRLYVIDRQGRVAFKSGRGPFGFRPLEMEQSLVLLLLEESQARRGGATPKAISRRPDLPN